MKSINAISCYRYSLISLFLYLLLIYPLSGTLPGWTSFENGPLETTQVIVLVGGALLCAYFSRCTLGSPTHGMWLPSAGIFLILAFRELSWGRVFMVERYSEVGEPILIASSAMPYRTAIHAAVAFMAVLCLYFLIRYVPWKRIFKEIRLPWPQLLLIAVCITLNTLGDQHAMLHTIQDQVIEELAELLMYLTFCHTAWYYYRKIEKTE